MFVNHLAVCMPHLSAHPSHTQYTVNSTVTHRHNSLTDISNARVVAVIQISLCRTLKRYGPVPRHVDLALHRNTGRNQQTARKTYFILSWCRYNIHARAHKLKGHRQRLQYTNTQKNTHTHIHTHVMHQSRISQEAELATHSWIGRGVCTVPSKCVCHSFLTSPHSNTTELGACAGMCRSGRNMSHVSYNDIHESCLL